MLAFGRKKKIIWCDIQIIADFNEFREGRFIAFGFYTVNVIAVVSQIVAHGTGTDILRLSEFRKLQGKIVGMDQRVVCCH